MTSLPLVQAILELVFVQRPLIEASNDFAYAYYPPYQWSQSGSVGTWRYEKQHAQGYRFERPDGVVVDIADILAITNDSVVVGTLVAYLASKGVSHVELERERVDIHDSPALEALLGRLASTDLLSRASEGFRLVRHVDLSKAVTLAQELAFEDLGTRLGPISIEAVFRELLWGPRETWRCFVEGLITRQEAANLLVAHFDSRLIGGQSAKDWDSLSFPLRRELWRCLPLTGPAALSIELVVLPPMAPLSVPTYNPDLDTVLSILRDVCDHLFEHRIVELAYRIGDTYVGADVRTDLCVVLEQLPAAIVAIAERRDFEIDNFEQGFETKLVFEWQGDGYTMTILRSRGEHGELAISADELFAMLVRLRDGFLSALRGVAPALEHHPWIEAWLGVRT
ncbi:MAG: hypothetical protein ACKV2T_07715 [Kofleriaceae bacterium]